MKRNIQVGVALLSCMTILGSNIIVLAEELPPEQLTPEQQYINESLATLGVNSPFYDTSFLARSDSLINDVYIDGLVDWFSLVNNPEYVDELDLEKYADISDPYWKLCILNNYKNTAYAEAPASTGVINCMQTYLMDHEVRIDGSNLVFGTGGLEAIGITQAEVDALPVYPVTDSWKSANLVFTDEFYQYTKTVSDLVWLHKGTYGGMRMDSGIPIVTSVEGGVPLGLVANQYWGDVYTGTSWTDAVTKCKVSMKYSYATPETGPYRGWQPFEFISLPSNYNWSSQQWRLILYGVPNEMDWKIIHSILNAITPDAEVIYQALRTEWGDPLGYGPWKYWDKWYDIGEQSRIRTWREMVSDTSIKSSRYLTNGPQFTKYYYDIAPRDNGATVDLTDRELVMEQRYGAKYY